MAERRVMSFAEFCKNSDASKIEKGTHPIVSANYSGEKKGDAGVDTLEGPKSVIEKGNGSAEHIDTIKGEDMSSK